MSLQDSDTGGSPEHAPEGISRRELWFPLILAAVIVLVDQITKAIIVAQIPLFYESGFRIEVFGDFLRIIHARNLGIAFSIGHDLPEILRRLLFVGLPLVVLGILVAFFYRSPELSGRQRWYVAAIIGGGVGNIIDRVVRPLGVVDFVDVRFYGLFGMERWPTFNVADSSVVVGGILLVISMLFTTEGQR